ncbi:MAG: SURF1 family protein [Gemmatimonadaceae bacterium]
MPRRFLNRHRRQGPCCSFLYMLPRAVAGAVLAVLAAALFVRLGMWQWHRLGERQARNALISLRLQSTALALDSAVTRDTAWLHFRRVSFQGVADTANELVLAGASHDGSPGVDLLTPMILGGARGAVLVNRGWVYSPDAATIDLRRWRESGLQTVIGYVAEFPPSASGGSVGRDRPGIVRHMDYRSIAARIPYSLAPFYVLRLGDSSAEDRSAPVRFALPTLDEGPHRSYAIQWFSFAAIALGGCFVFLTRAWTQVRARHAATAEVRS